MPLGHSPRVALFGCIGVLGAVVIAACGGTARVDGASENSAGMAGKLASAGGGNRCETVDCSNLPCRSDQMRVRRPGDCCDSCEAGGASGVAGTSSVGGASGVAGAPAAGGALGVAGAFTAGSGGALDCDGVTCELNCPQGEVGRTIPGRCCAQCGPQPPECLKGQAGYQQLFTTLIGQAGATSCVSDADCSLLPSFPKCGDPCRGTPVSAAAASEITTALSQWEDAQCSSCTPILTPCPASPPPVCVDGTCLRYHPL